MSIQSVVASESDACATVMALLSEEPFHRWLPDDEDEIGRHFGRDSHTVQPLISKSENTDRALDRHDPYATTTALDRPSPADWVRDSLNIVSDDSVVRLWLGNAEIAFRAEAWGAKGGGGNYAWSLTGYRLFAGSNTLLSLLNLCNRSLVIALKLRKYHKGRSIGRFGDASAFTHRSLLIVVNKKGQVWLPQRLSHQSKKALEKLCPNRRQDFYTRFRATAGLPNERPYRRLDLPVKMTYKRVVDDLSSNE